MSYHLARSSWQTHLDELRPLQPWARYYHFRAHEMQVVETLCPLPAGGTMLELGCGNAFHSYLLGERFDRVIATDLHSADDKTHTIGLQKAKHLARVLSLSNLEVVAAAADALPLADKSMDFVFSSNVLEHVPNRKQVVQEIRRVLRPGGQCLTIVPSAMERVYFFPISYVLVLRAILKGLRKHLAATAPSNGERPGSKGVRDSVSGKLREFLRKNYPSFPYPKPHGEYRSSTEEFLAHRPWKWRALFERNGFKVERTFSTILAPHTLGIAISHTAAYWIARAGWPLTRRFGAATGIKYLGTSFGVLASRPEGGQ